MSINPEALNNLLGIHPDTPLDIDGMCRSLRPLIYPAPHITERLEGFCKALSSAMQSLGIRVLDQKEAAGADGRFPAGTVIFAPGRFSDDQLAINRVSTLYNNLIVGIYDEQPPPGLDSLPQERLDAIVSRLAMDMVHILIFVTAQSWTICTMNGGVATFNTPFPSSEDVKNTLVPKITAQVVPPGPDDIDMEYGTLETGTQEFRDIADDFMQCGSLWKSNHSLVTHTSTEGLEYRSGFYRRIVARYLDRRSGMSYGFFARQRPVAAGPALHEGMALPVEHTAAMVKVLFNGHTLLVPVPTVSVITTRSGCRKLDLDPEKDLVEIGLTGGKAWMRTPGNSGDSFEARPSFDTLTILAHALGNSFAASILKTLDPGSAFPGHLERNGASMTHWHDYPAEGLLPEGYHGHGHRNPPVSCSTPQSAAYSLMGKIAALEKALAAGNDYRGDVHFEPNHGTNIVGMLSLAETAAAMNPKLGISKERFREQGCSWNRT